MNFILSFVGSLPDYLIDCIYQIRLYYNGDLYLILDDYSSNLLNDLVNKYNVKLIKYDDVNSDSKERLIKYKNKFVYSPQVIGRPYLFFTSFERMFLVNELINKWHLTDNIFMEIDNLIYNNPEKWINEFSKKEIAFMCNEINKCSTGMMYIKNKNSMKPVLDYMVHYIKTETDEWVSEMGAFQNFYELNKNYCYIMPSIFKDMKNNINEKIYENYNNNIFDPASYGQYLLGLDVFHTAGVIVTGKSLEHHYIVCNRYKIEWKITENGFKKPFILDENTNEWILINNLHVHSKDLKSGLSI